MGALRPAVLLVLVLAVAGSAAARSDVRHAALRRTATTHGAASSTNWSGYGVAAPGMTFTDVDATWVQPALTCPAGSSTWSSFWVGLGGFVSTTGLEQTGTEADCLNGQPVYSAWTEVLPDASVPAPVPVAAGDTISAEVAVAGKVVTLRLTNLTSGATFSQQAALTSNLDVSSAEWIAEAPSQCTGPSASSCHILPLANFGTVTFSGASTTAGGVTGTISNAAWTPTSIQLVGGAGSAVPSALSADGSSFGISAPGATPPAVVLEPASPSAATPGAGTKPKPKAKPAKHAKPKRKR